MLAVNGVTALILISYILYLLIYFIIFFFYQSVARTITPTLPNLPLEPFSQEKHFVITQTLNGSVARAPGTVLALAVMGGNEAGFDAARQKDVNQRINGLFQAINP